MRRASRRCSTTSARGRSAPDRPALTIGIATDGSAASVRELLDEIDPERMRIARFELRTASLDDVFLTLTRDHAHPETPESELANV